MRSRKHQRAAVWLTLLALLAAPAARVSLCEEIRTSVGASGRAAGKPFMLAALLDDGIIIGDWMVIGDGIVIGDAYVRRSRRSLGDSDGGHASNSCSRGTHGFIMRSN